VVSVKMMPAIPNRNASRVQTSERKSRSRTTGACARCGSRLPPVALPTGCAPSSRSGSTGARGCRRPSQERARLLGCASLGSVTVRASVHRVVLTTGNAARAPRPAIHVEPVSALADSPARTSPCPPQHLPADDATRCRAPPPVGLWVARRRPARPVAQLLLDKVRRFLAATGSRLEVGLSIRRSADRGQRAGDREPLFHARGVIRRGDQSPR
jgi:hypothetical protein